MSQLFYPRGVTPRMDLKQLSAQWLEQSIRGPHAISSEEPPAKAFMPFKWLPAIQYFDTLSKMREGVCLLKGTIVSSVNMLTAQQVHDTGPTEGNQTAWSNAQTFPFVYGHDGVLISKQLEYTRDAYGPDIDSLLVPVTGMAIDGANTCTHAAATVLQYTLNDVNMGRILPDGTALTSANYSAYHVDLNVNTPVGVVMDDIYVDYRGQFLNYQPEGKIVTNIYKQMEVVYPFVDLTAYTANYALAGGTHDFGDIKPSLDALWRYFWAPKASMVNGTDIIGDSVGNPTVDQTTYNDTVPHHILHEQQTVGMLDGVNSKQPHSLNDITDTPYGSGITGTDTAGVEAELFWFVHAVLTLGANVSPTAANILTAIRAGHFGFATLWINIR
jgi:hypothetical protein